MPISHTARKRQARRLARERGINYTTALRLLAKDQSHESASTEPQEIVPGSPGRNVFTDFLSAIPTMLAAAVQAGPQRLMVVCPPSDAGGVAKVLEGLGAPLPVVVVRRRTDDLPEMGTVILPESRMSMATQEDKDALATWAPDVLALPAVHNLLSESKRATLARRLSRSSAQVFAAVPTFYALGPTDLRSLLVLTKHAETTFGKKFTDDYLLRVISSFRVKNKSVTLLIWHPERRETLKKVLVERVLADRPTSWPMDARQD